MRRWHPSSFSTLPSMRPPLIEGTAGMARPTKYTSSYSFTGFQTQYPTSPMPAPRLDEQFDNIAQSLGQSIDAVNDIRRDDGKLKNGIVTPESLAASLNIGFTMAGQWQVGERYDAGDGVVHNQKFYVALVANTATLANAPDADSATWGYLFSVDDLVVAGALSIPVVSGIGDGVTKTFTLPVAPASVNNVFAKVGVNVLSINAYTVSGPSITLNTAPAIGVAYEFRILSTIAVTELEQAVYDARDVAVAKAAAAAGSATAAANSATAAEGSASAAANSASAANTSKNDAAASATAASNSASAATISASNASGSATSAGNSANAAAGSASAASTSAGNAANSATNAVSSATASGNSAAAAAGSASAAAISEDKAEDAAERAETAASGVQFPVSYSPQTLTSPQRKQARTNIDAEQRQVLTVTNISAPTVYIDLTLPSGYSYFELHGIDVYSDTENVALALNVSIDGGASFITDNSYRSSRIVVTGATTGSFIGSNVSIDHGIRFQTIIYPGYGAKAKPAFSSIVGLQPAIGGGGYKTQIINGMLITGGTATTIRLYMGTSNIVSGKFVLVGVGS